MHCVLDEEAHSKRSLKNTGMAQQQADFRSIQKR